MPLPFTPSRLAFAGVLSVTLLMLGSAAQARDVQWSIGISSGTQFGWSDPAPVVVAPAPIYYHSAPPVGYPPAVYAQPPVVYYGAPPVVYGPPPVVYGPPPVVYGPPPVVYGTPRGVYAPPPVVYVPPRHAGRIHGGPPPRQELPRQPWPGQNNGWRR